jgi:hypothetical protein
VVTDLLHYEKTRDQLTDILVRFLLSIGAFGEGALAEAGQIAAAGASKSNDLLAQLPIRGARSITAQSFPAAKARCASAKREAKSAWMRAVEHWPGLGRDQGSHGRCGNDHQPGASRSLRFVLSSMCSGWSRSTLSCALSG